MNDLIGVFDSGLGGISVMKTLRERLPDEHFLYYGDCGNAPYGPRPLKEIQALCDAVVAHLFDRDIKALVIACNTATSAYADIIRARRKDIPIIGMEPALKPAHFARHGGRVLVLATQATLRLEKFRRLMALYGDDAIPVIGKGLVELVEAGRSASAEAAAAVRELLTPYAGMQIDAVVLGCTHYPFLRQPIKMIFPEAQIFDGRDGTAAQLERRLRECDLLTRERGGSVEFETSGSPDMIERMKELMDLRL